MPKVCSKAAAGPALSRVFTPTNPTPRTLYSACAASSAGASTRHGGHAAYQTLTTNGAPRIATESNSSLPYVLPRISRGSASLPGDLDDDAIAGNVPGAGLTRRIGGTAACRQTGRKNEQAPAQPQRGPPARSRPGPAPRGGGP